MNGDSGMNEITKFDFKGNDIQTIMDEKGEPWFVAKDAATILSYASPDKAYRHCKHLKLFTSAISVGLHPSTKIIPESDLYRLVLNSHKPEAVEFQDWVTDVVLPAIRKTGGYVQGEESMSDDELALAAIQMLQRKVDERQKVIEAQALQLTEQGPKALLSSMILSTPPPPTRSRTPPGS